MSALWTDQSDWSLLLVCLDGTSENVAYATSVLVWDPKLVRRRLIPSDCRFAEVARKLGAEVIERRKTERQNVRGTVWFHCKDREESKLERIGKLVNLSTRGLFIEAANPPAVGTQILIRFEFSNPGKTPVVCVRTNGLVKRVESSRLQGYRGFAVSTGPMKLSKVGAGIPADDDGDR